MISIIKNRYLPLGLAMGTALLLASGCGKQESSTQTSTEGVQKDATPAAPSADNTSAKPALANTGAARNSISNAADSVANVITNAANSATNTIANAANSATNAVSQAADTQNAASNQTTVATAATNSAAALTNSANSTLSRLKTALTSSNSLVAPMFQAGTNQAQAAATTSTNQVSAMIEKAKGLISNQKYQDALTVVQQISSVQLTPEQQQLVNNLKTQVQTALAKQSVTNAASILGGFLGGKK